jgi:hypothetical protein
MFAVDTALPTQIPYTHQTQVGVPRATFARERPPPFPSTCLRCFSMHLHVAGPAWPCPTPRAFNTTRLASAYHSCVTHMGPSFLALCVGKTPLGEREGRDGGPHKFHSTVSCEQPLCGIETKPQRCPCVWCCAVGYGCVCEGARQQARKEIKCVGPTEQVHVEVFGRGFLHIFKKPAEAHMPDAHPTPVCHTTTPTPRASCGQLSHT